MKINWAKLHWGERRKRLLAIIEEHPELAEDINLVSYTSHMDRLKRIPLIALVIVPVVIIGAFGAVFYFLSWASEKAFDFCQRIADPLTSFTWKFQTETDEVNAAVERIQNATTGVIKRGKIK